MKILKRIKAILHVFLIVLPTIYIKTFYQMVKRRDFDKRTFRYYRGFYTHYWFKDQEKKRGK